MDFWNCMRSQRDRAILRVFVDSGPRAVELLGLTGSDVNWGRALIRARAVGPGDLAEALPGHVRLRRPLPKGRRALPTDRRGFLRGVLQLGAFAALVPGVGLSLSSEWLVPDEIDAFREARNELTRILDDGDAAEPGLA